MFTEYIFENIEYKLALRDLKATLFDIVANEEKKLSEIEAKADKEINEEIRHELVELCTQQKNYLNKFLMLTNEMVENLEILDSYSKRLKDLEDRNVAEIMATLEERQGLAKEEIEFDASKANIGVVSAEERSEEDTADKTEEKQDEEEIASGENDLNDQSSEEAEEEQEVASEESELNNQITEGVEEEKEVASEKGELNNQITEGAEEEQEVASEESELNNQITEGAEEEQEIASEEGELNNQTTEGAEEEQEEVASTLPETASIIPVVSNNDLVQNSEVAGDTYSSEEGDISLPPLNSGESQVTDNEVSTNNDINIPLIEVPVVNSQDGSIIQNSAEETQQEAISTEEVSKLTFYKENSESTKAILTSKVQNGKLRASKDTQKALLNARGSMGSLEVVQPSTSDTQVSEQQLINSGLLQPPTINVQQQIEEMLEQANELYKAGKPEEAQSLYDKISVLNSQSQANNGISK